MDITVTGKSGSAIQRAIDKAAAAGGGRISLKPGTYPCATIWLRSNIELHIPAGAKLLGSANPEDYEDFDDPRLPVAPEKSRKVLLACRDAENVAVTGDGEIDGQGPLFYDRNVPPGAFFAKPDKPRTRMVQFFRCVVASFGTSITTAADLDFVATWVIKEGETTPYLLTFIVQKTGYDAWLEQWNLPEGSDPLEVVNGVPLAARYLFGIVPMNRVTDIDGKGMLGIKFNASGAPCLTFPSLKVANDVNAVLTVVATPDLCDWVVAPGKTWPREYEVDLSQGLCLPDLGTPLPPKMFFRYKVAIGD